MVVEAIFTGPTLEPEIKVIESQGDASLVKSVRLHVAALRVPCLRDDEIPLRLRQEYVFKFEERKVDWTRPVDQADAGRRQQLECMAANDGSKTPEYPDWARRIELEGNMLAKLHFTAPDQPPQVTIYAASRQMKDLARSVEDWTEKLRLPCMVGGPLVGVVPFSFRIQGSKPFGFKSIGFLQLLRLGKDLDKQDVSFDTRTMACPFDIELQYRQPYLPNSVAENGPPVAARRPLLEWMSALVLDLNTRQLDAVLGDQIALEVPCLKLQLKPQEKTS